MESARNRWTDICLKEQIAPDQQVKDMLMEERVRIEGRQAVTQYEQDCRTVQAQLEQLGEVRAVVLGEQLRLSPGKKRERCHSYNE